MRKIFSLTSAIIALSFYCSFGQTPNWKFQTQGRIYSSPVISGDVVLFGSGDSTFYALHKHTGVQLWSLKTNGAIHSSPAITENLVVFSTSAGTLYALNIQNGCIAWQFHAEEEKMLDIWDYYLSSPCIYNGMVYWGSGDGHLYAIHSHSGAPEWKFKARDIVHASPIAWEGKIFFGDFQGYFYSLNALDGEKNWEFRCVGDTYFPNAEIQKGAIIHNGIVYFGSRDYNIYALDANTGRGHWNMKETGSWIIATPLIHENFLFTGTSDTHRFYCLNKNNGKIVWQIPLPMRVYGSAVEHNGLIYFGCFDGILRGLDIKTGETKWQFQTDGSKTNYPKVYNTAGQFKEGFELYGKDYLESEKLLHSLGAILSTPLIEDNTLFFGSSDGGFYSVGIK